MFLLRRLTKNSLLYLMTLVVSVVLVVGTFLRHFQQHSISWRERMTKLSQTQSLSVNSKDYLQPSLDGLLHCFSPEGSLKKQVGLRFTSSEKILAILGLTKLIIRWVKRCLRFAWASDELLLRREQASMVWQLQRHVHDLDLNALYIWDQRMFVASLRMFEQ